MTAHVVEWRIKRALPTPVGEGWTPLEGEEWIPESAAQERLKYWQGLSLAKLLEFRVVEVNR